ncbi:hypothetical protein C8A00DRAFT_35821 [Chaetomidium leptoderma]|uniref:Uncharacterized protein n=1 Tax=Chaetomidium leptoderma TaxID=669021 RepID=A0AAN6ZVE1_9PEZI|nr:hypothetical protein C8A00DRAFT_35821 [Chaetomidium leptoderma]
MFAHTLILAAASLATVSLGAILPGTNPILSADSAGIEARNASALALVDPAVRFTTYSSRTCGGGETYLKATDAGCFHLSGEGLTIREIADTCRVFVYQIDSCTGAEFQAEIGYCDDIQLYYGMKVFCH